MIPACQGSWFQRWWCLCGWQSAVRTNIWIKVLNALHPWRFYNCSDITCRPYKQHIQVLRQERKDLLDSLGKGVSFPSTEGSSDGLFPGNLKAEMKRQYVQFPLMSIYRHFSECCGDLKAVKMCELNVWLRMQRRVLSVCCVCVYLLVCVLSSAELPQLCSHFAQLSFNFQQLLSKENKWEYMTQQQYKTHGDALDYSFRYKFCTYVVPMKLTGYLLDIFDDAHVYNTL